MSEGEKERRPAGKPIPAVDAKADRLAAALRANLKRRKAQARDRAAPAPESGSGPRETGPKSR
jgi:hypothetical protein